MWSPHMMHYLQCAKARQILVSSIDDSMAMQTQIILNYFMSHSWDHIWSMVAMCGILTYQRIRHLLKCAKIHLSKLLLLLTGIQATICRSFSNYCNRPCKNAGYMLYSVGCSRLSTDCAFIPTIHFATMSKLIVTGPIISSNFCCFAHANSFFILLCASHKFNLGFTHTICICPFC